MKAQQVPLPEKEQIELKKMLGSTAFRNFKRVLAARRDILAVGSIDDQLAGGKFPKRADDAQKKAADAARVQSCLGLLAEFEASVEAGIALSVVTIEPSDPLTLHQ